MEEDLKLFGKIKDDLYFKVNERRPQFQGKWNTTSISRRPQWVALASPELGTAQPQLVKSFVGSYKY